MKTQFTAQCRKFIRSLPLLCETLLLPVFLTVAVAPARAAVAKHAVSRPSDVLVVANINSRISMEIANDYMHAHRIDPKYRCLVLAPDTEQISYAEYQDAIEKPIQRFLQERHLSRQIDYIVLTKGVPLIVHQGSRDTWSVDSLLTVMDIQGLTGKQDNPYFGADRPFSHRRYSIYLVTRLDGYTLADVNALIRHAVEPHSESGLFVLDVDPGRNWGGYKDINDEMISAAHHLKGMGLPVMLDKTGHFLGGIKNIIGYYSWGSNDYHFSEKAFLSLRFMPGAIAETAVSTSARTFQKTSGGQSLIADLIHDGVTGVKGYVSEPYVDALCHADLLFERYAEGFNLAESFYIASPYLHWKDVVVGDPLCRVYPFHNKTPGKGGRKDRKEQKKSAN
ncbi:MAG: TIGR03790 family protein [Armatimonadetes bacterium]|nr:TIGR03790 family protein [Armatimonadota bacterium]